MKARQLVDGASFGPEALKAMCQAFDEAWESIAGNFGNEPAVVEEARLRLAKAVLSVADEDSRDPEPLIGSFLQRKNAPAEFLSVSSARRESHR